MKSKKPEQKKPSELRKRVEDKLKTETTPPKIMSDKETRQLIHELQVHQIELEMQNEELRRWQDVMLGREDRVQELKREVNEVRRRIGETARYPSQEANPADSEIVSKKEARQRKELL